jgi:UDP-N-acetyl-2-amino-2-deoxyglucuronate dehydrogenase
MNDEDKIGFGVIGCGRIGKWHIKQINQFDGMWIAGVTDIDPEARKNAAKAVDAKEFNSVETLLRCKDIKVVSICTPPQSHVPLIESAAAASKHILVEKPLALTTEEADQAIQICAKKHLHLGVVHQHRARSATRMLKALIETGELGTPIFGVATHTWFKTQASFDKEAWRGDVAAGGAFLFDQAIHAIDLLIWFLGKPRWVIGATRSLARKNVGEDTVAALVEFENGSLAALTASTSTNMSRDDIAIDIAGTRGGFRLEIRDYDHAEIVRLNLARKENQRARELSPSEIESLVETETGNWRRGPKSFFWRLITLFVGSERGSHPFRSPRAYLRRQIDRISQQEHKEPQGHAAILFQMGEAVRGHIIPTVSGEEARESISVIEAIYRSQASGGRRTPVI